MGPEAAGGAGSANSGTLGGGGAVGTGGGTGSGGACGQRGDGGDSRYRRWRGEGTAGAGGTSGTGGGAGSAGSSGAAGVGRRVHREGRRHGQLQRRPVLTPGVWKDITPAGLGLTEHPPPFGIPVVELDPSDPCTLYACVDTKGIWKTTDAGSTWARLGNPPASPNYSHNVDYLDSPIHVLVDPDDSKHLYATQGVRGTTLGFWVSTTAERPGHGRRGSSRSRRRRRTT